MTNPEAMLNKVRGKRYVSTIDLRQSFFQLEITEKAKDVQHFGPETQLTNLTVRQWESKQAQVG